MMDDIRPLLLKAASDLKTLDNKTIAEIKSIKKNPGSFPECVLYCVSIILDGIKPKKG